MSSTAANSAPTGAAATEESSTNGRGSAWPSMSSPPSSSSDLDDNGEVVSVPAIMNYVSSATGVISTRRDLSGSDSPLEGAEWSPTVVRVHNARRHEGKLALDENGFERRRSELASGLGGGDHPMVDFLDQDDVTGRYYPLCERLVADALQSSEAVRGGETAKKKSGRVVVRAFDHNVRSSSSAAPPIKNKRGTEEVQNPAGLVHADYTAISAPRRLEQLSLPPKRNDVLLGKKGGENPDAAADADADNNPTTPPMMDPVMVKEAIDGKRRFAIINVWRNIQPEPVRRFPLACIDAGTVRAADLRTFQIHYADRVGENYFACHPENKGDGGGAAGEGRAGHRWYYYPDLEIDEVLILKQWDSAGGIAAGRDRDGGDGSGGSKSSTFTVHSAFDDPTSSPDAPARTSIEVRCAVIWEEEEEEE